MSFTACYKMEPLCQGVGPWEQSAYTRFKTLSRLLPEQAMYIHVIPTQDGQCYIVTFLQLCQN